MVNDYLEDEQRIAHEQDNHELFDSHALQRPISELPDLQPIVRLAPTATVAEAIDGMADKGVGCVLVVEEGRLVGVFSERDVLRKIANTDVDPKTTPLSSLMTANPETLRGENEVVYALHQMSIGGYRHVPIVDQDGKPSAVVSMRDIVNYIVSLYPDEVLKLPPSPDQSITRNREGA